MRKRNLLKKISSLMTSRTKLSRAFYVILTKGLDYDSKKRESDIRRPEIDLHVA